MSQSQVASHSLASSPWCTDTSSGPGPCQQQQRNVRQAHWPPSRVPLWPPNEAAAEPHHQQPRKVSATAIRRVIASDKWYTCRMHLCRELVTALAPCTCLVGGNSMMSPGCTKPFHENFSTGESSTRGSTALKCTQIAHSGVPAAGGSTSAPSSLQTTPQAVATSCGQTLWRHTQASQL